MNSDSFANSQYQIYNMVLRRWPDEGYQALNGNTYATTIHCLVSAVTKISRVTKLPDGLLLYRGLGGIRLPDGFYKGGPAGFKCFVEWGFMSTTSNKDVAVHYTGISKGRAFPTLLQVCRPAPRLTRAGGGRRPPRRPREPASRGSESRVSKSRTRWRA